MAKSKTKKKVKPNEAEAYQPWLEAEIPGEARIFPPIKCGTSFSALLEEVRAVFDPKQILINLPDEEAASKD